MAGAIEFTHHFAQSYRVAREKFDDPAWKIMWTSVSAWSHFMLWDEDSVIRATGSSLGFMIARGERMRLDAVFVRDSVEDVRDRFPTQIALEHENAPGTFANEIQLLLSVRAPLKVGITYSLTSHRRTGWNPTEWLQKQIAKEFDRANMTLSESPETQYLFLLGEEEDDKHFVLQWRSMSFFASHGPLSSSFT